MSGGTGRDGRRPGYELHLICFGYIETYCSLFNASCYIRCDGMKEWQQIGPHVVDGGADIHH